MNTFEYLPVKTVKEACDLLSQYGVEAKILGGGQSLMTLMKQDFVSPAYIIDIKGLSDLDYIRYDKKDGLRLLLCFWSPGREQAPVCIPQSR